LHPLESAARGSPIYGRCAPTTEVTNLIRQLAGRSDRSIWDDQDFSASRRALSVRQGSADFIDGVDSFNRSPQSIGDRVEQPSTPEQAALRIERGAARNWLGEPIWREGGIMTKTEDNPMHLKTREPSRLRLRGDRISDSR
jgi:hypothetical protein